jgi:hypothetical protein
MCSSILTAQIIKIDEGSAETRVLIRPDPSVEAAMKGIARELIRWKVTESWMAVAGSCNPFVTLRTFLNVVSLVPTG